MKRTIIVGGYGPGISEAVARKFGAEGYAVALAGRTEGRVTAGAAALVKDGIVAKGFACDLSKPDDVRALVKNVRASLGPVAVLHWNGYMPLAGDLTTASNADLRAVLDLAVNGLVAGVQEALPDLKKEKGAVLVTGGGLAFYDPKVDAVATEWGAMGLAVAKAAQHKLVGVLHQKLGKDGVYVGEVTVLGIVKRTAFAANGGGQLEPDEIAERFWQIFQKRSDIWVNFPDSGHSM